MKGITSVMVVILASCVAACGPAPRGTGDDGPCTDGTIRCNGLEVQRCDGGDFTNVMTCDTGCTDNVGCTVCSPNTGTCNGNMSHACAEDGSGYVDSFCDPVQGMGCDANSGQCTGDCAPTTLGQSYIGCEYYPTVTGNTVGNTFDFAVAIANTANNPANITIENGAYSTPTVVTVPANSVKIQTLPWVAALKLCNAPEVDHCIDGSMAPGALAAKGSYHLRSTQPITVYQFNSLQYAKGADFSYSNDASLLLPTNVWRKDYLAAAWQPSGLNPGELAVVASQDGTQVMITTKADTLAGGGAPAFVTNAAQAITLNAGDALELTSNSGDLTGSRFVSNKPIQVISGAYCANVPDGVAACDHMEESMFGVETLGRRYFIDAPAVTTIPNGKVQIIRIVATEANTNLTYNPAQANAPTTLAKAGDFVQLPASAASFLIEADKKVLVAQYMEGQNAGGGTGDPAMALAVPIEQFRGSYMFHAPTNYDSNYVDVVAPTGASVTLDGQSLNFTPIGNTGYGLVRVFPLTAGPQNDGNHTMTGNMPFGISVYGYGRYTSYWYPGGLNLTSIIN